MGFGAAYVGVMLMPYRDLESGCMALGLGSGI